MPTILQATLHVLAAGDPLAGDWKLVKLTTERGSFEPQLVEVTLHIDKGNFRLKWPDVGDHAGKAVLDAGKHRLDLLRADGTGFRGIHKLEKDKLTFCWWRKAEDVQGTFDLAKQKPAGPA